MSAQKRTIARIKPAAQKNHNYTQARLMEEISGASSAVEVVKILEKLKVCPQVKQAMKQNKAKNFKVRYEA